MISGSLIKFVSHHLATFDLVVVLCTWASALLGAALTFFVRTDHGLSRTPRNLLRYTFPAILVRHKSVRLDVLYAAASKVVHPLTVGQVIVGNVVIARVAYAALTARFGPHPQRHEALWLWVLILAGTVVLADFCTFLCHLAEHKVRPLWEFHKVHHSTLFLVPLSNRRIHPVQETIDAAAIMLAVGSFLAVTSYFLDLPIRDNVVMGVDAYFVANLLSFYHLRHSHIPMAYGWLEYVFMSPAQHQMHHSSEVRHWDRNFGLLLSCWDLMAGTFLRSGKRDFALGLPAAEQRQYSNVLCLYLVPLLNLARMVSPVLASPRHSSADQIARRRPDVEQEPAIHG